MANGRTHRAVGLTLAVGATVGGTFYDFYPESWAVGVGCVVAAMLFNPDLDVDGGFIGNAAARKMRLETLYRVLFRPYQLAYKHRSWWSHGPITSTLWRMVYLMVPLVVVLFKEGLSLNQVR